MSVTDPSVTCQYNSIPTKFLHSTSKEVFSSKISRNSDVRCINLKGRQLKEANTFLCLVIVVIRNGKIQNEINDRIKKSITILSCKEIIKKQGHQ